MMTFFKPCKIFIVKLLAKSEAKGTAASPRVTSRSSMNSTHGTKTYNSYLTTARSNDQIEAQMAADKRGEKRR